jgi:uncharacterized protein involved in exopolysaccharide biosynthesis
LGFGVWGMVKDIVTYLDETNMAMIQKNKIKTAEELKEKINLKTTEIELLSDSLKGLSGIKSQLVAQKQAGLVGEINSLERLLSQYEISSSSKFASVYMVENPSPADKKSKPVRWLILAATAIISFILMSVLAILIDFFKKESISNA